MHWHIDSDIISLLATCLIILYQRRLHPDSKEKLRSRWYEACLWICAGVTLIDILASVVMDVPINRFVYHAMMTLYFVSVILVILSWFFFSLTILYADNPKRGHLIALISAVPYAIYTALAVSNPWTGLFYALNENMVYTRGPLFFLMVAVFVAYTMLLLILTLVRKKHIAKRYSAAVLMLIPILLAISIAVQLLNNGWLVILPMYCICLLLAFFFLQSEELEQQNILVEHLSIEASTDRLTGVLNRTGAEARILAALAENPQTQCLVIFVDVDDLKIINDTLGHEGGDKALVAIADRLKSFFGPSDIVARYGGDEFVACLFSVDGDARAHELLERLHHRLSGIPIGGMRTVNASIGASWGIAGQSAIDTLLHQADTALYSVKRNGKNGFALYIPAGE